MTRYLVLYAYFLRFSFSRAMEFRLDFFFRVVMDTVFYIAQIVFFLVLFQHTNLLGEWTLDQMLIFTAAFLMADALNMTFVSNNMWWFPILVNKGDLDYYLVRPVSSLFFLMLRDFAANSFMNLVMAAGILAWALLRYTEPLGTGPVLLFLAALIIGNVIFAFITMLFLIPVFWMHSSQGLRELLYQTHGFMGRPHQIFHGWVRRVITSVLPMALIASWPTHVLLEGGSLWRFGYMLLVMTLLWAFVVWFWKRGLRAYVSASS
jgi:ABC-2 type transport system permease protein